MTHRSSDDTAFRGRGDSPACDRFDELLPDYFEGLLAPDARSACERHRAACARCGALAADVERVVHEAAALATLRPGRDLWPGIATRIDAPVVSLDRPGARAAAAPTPRVAVARRWLGAAAAALVVVTSGVTYLATRAPARPDAAVAARAPVAGDLATADAGAPPATPGPGAALPSVRPADAAPAAVRPAPRASRPEPAGVPSDARLARLDGAGAAAVAPGAPAYDREIAAMRDIVRERSADLDPATVRVLEESLRIVDGAIARSRAALARDPNSRFLGDQLVRALDSKVELLRTVALLPRRGA